MMDIDISKLGKDELKVYIDILNDPIKWSETFLLNPEDETPFRVNPVQKHILGSKSQKTVVRVHRRAGKSYGLTVYALWYALTHDAAKILIICPDMGKVQALFNSIDDFLNVSDAISNELVESTKSPHFRKKFKNGSVIMGFTAGSSSKSGGKGIRGQTADVVIVDEAAFLNPDDWTAIEPIMKGDSKRPRVISFVSSTPTAERGRYWEMCTKRDNGWFKVHVPVTENPEYSPERVAEIRADTNDLTWIQEWMAEFPEIGEGRVYKDSYIDRAQRAFSFYNIERGDMPPAGAVRTIGVDWDKSQGVGPNIVVLELDRENGLFRLVYHEEIPPDKYCLTVATQRIIELNAIFNPHYIYVDRGLGEVQVEYLHLYGEQHPESQLATRVRGVSFSETTEVFDPATREMVKKRVKPYMVNITVKWFEDNRIVYPKTFYSFTEQLQQFRVVSVSDSNIKYSSENEHIIDAFCLAAYAMHANFNDPFAFKPASTSYMLPVPEVVQTKIYGPDGKPQYFGIVPEKTNRVRKDFGRRSIPTTQLTREMSRVGVGIRKSF